MIDDDCSTLSALFTRHARRTPERVFCQLRQAGRTRAVRYGELHTLALRYASGLRAAGLGSGEIVAIVLPQGDDLLAAFMGAMLAGGVPACLAPASERQDSTHHAAQLQAQCRRMGRGVLVTQEALRPLAERVLQGSAMRSLTEAEARRAAPAEHIADRGPDDTALLQHSSGTTGARKGVALSHRAILTQLRHCAAALSLSDDDAIVSWLPLYHDMGLISGFLLPLASAVPLVLLDPFEWVATPLGLLHAITEHRGTLCWLPNFAFHFLARAPLPAGTRLDLSAMRAFINCSEPCKGEAFDAFAARFAAHGVHRGQLQVSYAMAETVFAVTQTPPGVALQPLAASCRLLAAGRLAAAEDADDRRWLMPVGAPLPGSTVTVVDAAGAALPDGVVGELAITSDCLFSGYFGDAELSARVLQDGRYRSGDLGAVLDGRLYITGREKDLVIVNGKNFYVHDIEAAVNAVDGVKPGRCVAFGLFHEGLGSECVHVVAETDAPADRQPALARAIKQQVQQQLGLTIARALVVQGRWLVKTTSGKVSRRENREKYQRAVAVATPASAPATAAPAA